MKFKFSKIAQFLLISILAAPEAYAQSAGTPPRIISDVVQSLKAGDQGAIKVTITPEIPYAPPQENADLDSPYNLYGAFVDSDNTRRPAVWTSSGTLVYHNDIMTGLLGRDVIISAEIKDQGVIEDHIAANTVTKDDFEKTGRIVSNDLTVTGEGFIFGEDVELSIKDGSIKLNYLSSELQETLNNLMYSFPVELMNRENRDNIDRNKVLIKELRKLHYKGMAQNAALAAVDFAYIKPKALKIGAGVGYSRGYTALAVGLAYAPTYKLLANLKWSGGSDSFKNSTIGFDITYRFGSN